MRMVSSTPQALRCCTALFGSNLQLYLRLRLTQWGGTRINLKASVRTFMLASSAISLILTLLIHTVHVREFSPLYPHQYTMLQEKRTVAWNNLIPTLLGTGISFWFVEKSSAHIISTGAEETHTSMDSFCPYPFAHKLQYNHKSHALLWEQLAQMSHVFSPCHKTLCFSSATDLAIALLSMPSDTLGTRWQSATITLHSHNLSSYVKQHNYNKEGNRLPHHKLPDEPDSITFAAIRATM